MIGPQCPIPIGFIGFETPARRISLSMISCNAGSASSPYGRGQCGTTYPASTRSRAVGAGCVGEPTAYFDAARVVFGG